MDRRVGRDNPDDSENLNLNRLRGKGIDYLALGHIHQHREEKLDDRGIYVYSGCLDGRGFDECGEKGFVLVETGGGRVHTRLCRFPAGFSMRCGWMPAAPKALWSCSSG